MKYDLPSSNASLKRTLLTWGLPIAGWAVLILLWMLFAGRGEKTDEVATTETKPAAEAVQPAGEGAQASVQPGAGTAAVQPAATPEVKPATPEAPTNIFPSTPYDFAGAVSFIGLPNERGCGTGILVDPAKRKVLWAKSAEKAVPIASMTKMMTMLLAEEAIQAGRVTRETVIPVSVEAYKIGGSQVWLDPKEAFPLGELMKAIAIKSANDAAYLVGEYLGGGDIGAFIKEMNRRAKALGMAHTTFYDAHGLGDAAKRDNLSSAYDMVLLGEHLLRYPETMRLASTRMDTFRNGKTELKNHNNLVYQRVAGVDGLKTGYTRASGYCVTFSCLRGGRRLVGCVTGFSTAKERDAFCKALLAWGYTK